MSNIVPFQRPIEGEATNEPHPLTYGQVKSLEDGLHNLADRLNQMNTILDEMHDQTMALLTSLQNISDKCDAVIKTLDALETRVDVMFDRIDTVIDTVPERLVKIIEAHSKENNND